MPRAVFTFLFLSANRNFSPTFAVTGGEPVKPHEFLFLVSFYNKGAWTGSFENDDCVQPGEQTEHRYRYRADAQCSLESQIRKRSNGGKWSAWKCKDRSGKDVECKAEKMSCRHVEEKTSL